MSKWGVCPPRSAAFPERSARLGGSLFDLQRRRGPLCRAGAKRHLRDIPHIMRPRSHRAAVLFRNIISLFSKGMAVRRFGSPKSELAHLTLRPLCIFSFPTITELRAGEPKKTRGSREIAARAPHGLLEKFALEGFERQTAGQQFIHQRGWRRGGFL